MNDTSTSIWCNESTSIYFETSIFFST
jgi:hypothetical protein